uniref:Uncharacterized protein n=1 Tax=viral metagenome TaxID=1070528 RepID=A0A6M3JNY9_9ZZZZ
MDKLIIGAIFILFTGHTILIMLFTSYVYRQALKNEPILPALTELIKSISKPGKTEDETPQTDLDVEL